MKFDKIPFEKCLQKTRVPFKLKKKYYLEKGKFPVVSQEGELISGYHNELNDVYHINKPVIIFGDHTQVVKYIDFDFVAGADGIKILLPIKKINSKYFYYVLQLLMPKNIGYARHYKLLKKLKIPVPSLPEQKYIVSKLDNIFSEIDKNINMTKKVIKRTETLFQIYLEKIFKGNNSWKETTIKKITENTKNVNPKKTPNVKFRYVDVSSVSNKEFKIFETHLLLGKDAPSRAKKNIITNDIIFATVRPTLKRIAIVPEELNNQVASTGYAILRTNKSNYFKFLFYFLLSDNFIKKMGNMERGANYPAVTDADIKLQKLKVPNYQEQINISKKLDDLIFTINFIIKSKNKKIIELNFLKKSILQKIFNQDTTIAA